MGPVDIAPLGRIGALELRSIIGETEGDTHVDLESKDGVMRCRNGAGGGIGGER